MFRSWSDRVAGDESTRRFAGALVCAALGCGDSAQFVTLDAQPLCPAGGTECAPAEPAVHPRPPADGTEATPPVDAPASSVEPVPGGEGGAAGEGPGEVPLMSGGAAGTSEVGTDPVPDGCWQLPVVDHVRLRPALGAAAALVGGKIVGSNQSAMNGFVDLVSVSTVASDAEWVDLSIANATAYRYVKYYGPPGSYGAVAEVEFYAGAVRLGGQGFGTAVDPGGVGSPFQNALDGNLDTAFLGTLPNDNYVGVDLGSEHVAAVPTFAPAAGDPVSIGTVSVSGDAGTQIYYTLDGSDPSLSGIPYSGPITLPASSVLLRAAARGECSLWSAPTQTVYRAAGASAANIQSSMHIGNSLTDTIVDHMEDVARGGGITLDFNRYTVPGAGTWVYDEFPSGGFGVLDVQVALRTRPFDHLSLQPYPNMPCQATASADGTDSDSLYLDEAWTDARSQNQDVQLWIYQQWPDPLDPTNCLTGGGWTRGDWAPPAPATWEEAVNNELSYQEVVRAELIRLHPEAPVPYIVPGGSALVLLKQAIEAGDVPGMNDFFGDLFLEVQPGSADIHLNGKGAHYITLVFYACMFERDPLGLPTDVTSGLTDEQTAVFQRLAWQAVSDYPLSGVNR